MNTYPVGTGEYVYVSVVKTNPSSDIPQSVSSGVTASVVPTGTSPGSFTATTLADGYPAIDISTLAAGTYDVYVKATDPTTGRGVIKLAGSIVLK